MPHSGFSRPSLPTLIDTIRSDLFTRCQEDSVLRRCDTEVYARVQAAAVHTLYGYLDYLARNLLPDLADEAWLGRHANIKRCPRKGATTAQGFVRWEGVLNALSMSSDTEIQRDDGQTYTTTRMTSVVNGVLRVPVRAQKAGQAGNCEDRTALRLTTPIPGLSSTGYADEIQGGHDIEDLERWRQRIIARWYDVPQGGADGDYVRWAKAVPGIDRAWTHRHHHGIGTVGVMVATDDPDHPAPTADLLTQVRDHLLPLIPVAGSGLTVFGVTPKPIPVSLALSTDRPDIRSAVIAEIQAFFQRQGEPGNTLFLSRLREVISLAAGEVAHQLRLPATDMLLGKTEVPVLGLVTWTPYAP
ncbi:Tail protein [Candidatus Hamiltonella defensa (Bemisia tabaci)]|nr:Tail protein [Candidatus Hamiltonella defensa (Bemisia tabaci)]